MVIFVPGAQRRERSGMRSLLARSLLLELPRRHMVTAWSWG
jgi:hypothetical protein